MNLNSGDFKTGVHRDAFLISMTYESDVSLDGGHTFEDVTSVYELGVDVARALIKELEDFITNREK